MQPATATTTTTRHSRSATNDTGLFELNADIADTSTLRECLSVGGDWLPDDVLAAPWWSLL